MSSNRDERFLLRIGHSPDPDDAFMWWPLLPAADGNSPVDTGRFRFEAVIQDIETLNRRSETADLEITAMSCAQFPTVQDRYALTACGASMGENYGPKLVARSPMSLDDLRALLSSGDADGPKDGPILAIPGRRTSAFGTVSLMLGPGSFRYEEVPFEDIIDRVAAGEYAAGVVIHEGQLTFEDAGLHLVEDLGSWWWRRHSLPLPLGVNAIRRDLDDAHGLGTGREVTAILARSVAYALEHREESIRHALAFARDMGSDLADTFIGMYVNTWTLDFGPTGRRAVTLFLEELHAAGLARAPEPVDFVAAAP